MATKIIPNSSKVTPNSNNIANSSDILKLLESSMENSNKVLTQLNDIGKYLKNYKSVKQNLNKYVMFINDVLQAYQQISVNQLTLQGLLKQNISGEIFKKLFTDISSIAEGVQVLSNIKITKRMIKRVVNNINRLPEILNFNITIDKEKIKQLSESVEQLKGVFDDIVEIYKSLENISKKSILVTLLLPVILVGMMALSLTTFIIATNIMFISGVLTALIPILGPCVGEVVVIINAMEEIFKSVFEISKICIKMIFIQVFINLGFKALNKVIQNIISIFDDISKMNTSIKLKEMIEATINIHLMGVIINKINKIIKKLVITVLLFPIGLLGLLCLRILISSISLLFETLTNINFQITIIEAFEIIKKLTLSFLLLTTMSIALTLFGLLVLKQYKALVVGILSMIVILGAMYLMFRLIKLIGKIISESILQILLLIVAITLISVAIGVLVLVTMLADQISWEAFGKVAAIIGGFILLLVLASVFSAFILIGTVALALVGLAMVMIVAPLLILSIALILLQSIDVESGMFALRTLLVGFVTTLVSVFTLDNMIGLFVATAAMIPLTMISVSLIAIIVILKIVSVLMGDDMVTQMGNLSGMLNIYIQTIVGVFTLKNMLGLFVATAAMVPLTMISVSLIVVVGVLKLVSELMNEDLSPSMQNLGSLLNGFIEAITGCMDLKTTLKLGLAMPAIVMIGAAALAISGVAKTIQLLSSLKVPTKFDKDGNPIEFEVMTTQHFEDAKKNIMTICTAFSSALTSPEMVEFLNTEYKNGEENMKLLGAMGNAVGGMVQGVVSLSEGRVAKFSEDGKEIVGYNSIGDILNDVNKQNELKRNLSNLLGIYISAVTSSDVQAAGKGDTWFTDSKMTTAEGVFKKLNESIVPAVNTIIENIAKLNSDEAFKSIDETTIKTKLSTILSAYVNSIAELDTSKVDNVKLNTFERLQKIIGKLHEPINENSVKTQKQSLDNISKFIDKANSIDTNKIKSTTDMFTQMAKLSESIKGNFDSLADALNDNLMEVLEELRDILKETNGIIEDKSKDNRSFGIMSSVSNNSTPISQSQPTNNSTPISQSQPTNNTTNNTTKDNQSKPTDITPVIEKLESLLQQFKSGVPVYSKIGQPLQVRTT